MAYVKFMVGDFAQREKFIKALARGNSQESVPTKIAVLKLLRRFGCLDLTGLHRRLAKEGKNVSIGCLHNYIKDLAGSSDWHGLLGNEHASGRVFIYVKDQQLVEWLFSESAVPEIDAEVVREIRFYLNVARQELNSVSVRSRHESCSLLDYSSILLMKLSALSVSPITSLMILNKIVRAVRDETTVHELDELLAERLRELDPKLANDFDRLTSDQTKLETFETIMKDYRLGASRRSLWAPSAVKLYRAMAKLRRTEPS